MHRHHPDPVARAVGLALDLDRSASIQVRKPVRLGTSLSLVGQRLGQQRVDPVPASSPSRASRRRPSWRISIRSIRS